MAELGGHDLGKNKYEEEFLNNSKRQKVDEEKAFDELFDEEGEDKAREIPG
jgi:hypothetical protein